MIMILSVALLRGFDILMEQASIEMIVSNIILLFLLVLCVKSLIIAFSPKCKKILRHQKANFLNILLVCLICLSTISFIKINNYKNENVKEYPPLNNII